MILNSLLEISPLDLPLQAKNEFKYETVELILMLICLGITVEKLVSGKQSYSAP